jgi:hypothetical protein
VAESLDFASALSTEWTAMMMCLSDGSFLTFLRSAFAFRDAILASRSWMSGVFAVPRVPGGASYAFLRTRIASSIGPCSPCRYAPTRSGGDAGGTVLRSPPPRFSKTRLPMFRTLALVLLGGSAFGGTMYAGGSSPMQPMPFSATVNVQQFDPSLGQLRSVSILVLIEVQGVVSVENTSAFPITNGLMPNLFYAGATGGASWCNNFLGSWEQGQGVPDLAAFDGTLDHAGPSAGSSAFSHHGCAWDNSAGSTESPYLLEAFTGTGTVAVGGSGSAYFTFYPWSVDLDTTTTMNGGVQVSVTYTYDDFPATFCAPTNTSMCPCQNTTFLPGAGCANSHTGGAVLTGSGEMRVLADSFVLEATNLPPSTSVLFFQGTSANLSGAFLGDGMRCAGGQLTRLGVKQAVAGAAHYPGQSDPPISVKGSVPVGALRYYQAWYRDADPAFCTLAQSNVSSAVSALWMP